MIKAESQLSEAMVKTQCSDLDNHRGLLLLQQGDKGRERYHLEQALVKWPPEGNKAYAELQLLDQ